MATNVTSHDVLVSPDGKSEIWRLWQLKGSDGRIRLRSDIISRVNKGNRSIPMETNVTVLDLIRKRIMKTNETLFSPDGQHEVLVTHDGWVHNMKNMGSIHSVASAITGDENIDGWAFWHTKDSLGKLIPLFVKRQKLMNIEALEEIEED